ncbi:hypothetical protein [Roseovarius indicus]|uniref:hypothetical protein n=1 Tax=Roseovarius indicus TaxID=540747 RepID=UPI0013655147|nr:hypothetical protein [Roseovarius indicus]
MTSEVPEFALAANGWSDGPQRGIKWFRREAAKGRPPPFSTFCDLLNLGEYARISSESENINVDLAMAAGRRAMAATCKNPASLQRLVLHIRVNTALLPDEATFPIK